MNYTLCASMVDMRIERQRGLMLAVGILILVGGLIALGRSRLLRDQYRYNLVVTSQDGGVRFVSFDPEQREVTSLVWPGELLIKSRSVGSYRVSDLYKLGSYEGRAGEFARLKMQGFMKVPMMSYLELPGAKNGVVSGLLRRIVGRGSNDSITRMDAVIILLKYLSYQKNEISISELVRAGVLTVGEDEIYEYQASRLQSFLGQKMFDWGVGRSKLTVAVVNESGITGLASEVAEFLENVGLDVVAVRSGEGEMDTTKIATKGELSGEQLAMIETLSTWFGWSEYDQREIGSYRAELVIFLGKDAVELF